MNFSLKEYLPNSEARIARLRKIIAGRPVAILAAGPSLQELEERIDQLRHTDICYFGMNKFFLTETPILHKIGKHCSIISLSGREGMPEAIEEIIDFLNRDEDNMFISSFWRDPFGLLDGFNLEQFLEKYDKKLLFFSLDAERGVPNHDRPLHFMESNSLLVLIQLALIGKAESIVLFGADGHGSEVSKKFYYNQAEYALKGWPVINRNLMNDTRHRFNPIASMAIRNTCKAYNLPLVNILNCSPKSLYTPFPKVSYAEALEYLITGKKLIGKLDLRVPPEPKAPNVFLVFMERALNFLKKYRWNAFTVITARVWYQLIKIFTNKMTDRESYAE